MSHSNQYKATAVKLLYGHSLFWIVFCFSAAYNLYTAGATSTIYTIVCMFLLILFFSIINIKQGNYTAAKYLTIIAPPYFLLFISIYAKTHGIFNNVFFYLLPRIFVIFTLMAPIVFFGIRLYKKLFVALIAIVPPIFFFELIHSFFGILLRDLPFKHEYYPQFIGFLCFVYAVPLVSLILYQIVNLRYKNKIDEKSKIVTNEKIKVLALNEQLASNSNLFKIYEISTRDIPLKQILQEVLDELLSLQLTIMQNKGSILLKDELGYYEIMAQCNCKSTTHVNETVSRTSCLCDQSVEKNALTNEPKNNSTTRLIFEQDEFDILPHGHYLIPLVDDNGNELGLMNIYINDGQKDDEGTVYFLEKVAGILSRKIIFTRQINLLAEKNTEIKVQREKLLLTHLELTESVSYAKLLQNSLLPNIKKMLNCLDEISILFLPKEQIGGDLYFTHHENNLIYFGVGDCTGHGIPGALLAAMSIEAIKSVINIHCGEKPNFILEKLRKIAKNRFRNSTKMGSRSDSMDGGLCMYDKEKNMLYFAGGFMNLIIIRNNEILEFQAERCPIGIYPDEKPFSLQSVKLQKNDSIYLATDGYTDQFGYDSVKKRSIKFKRKRFKELIKNISYLSCDEQVGILKNKINTWKGDEEQIDDITVLIVKPSADSFHEKQITSNSLKKDFTN